jgi:tRNA (guanine37-N1)-methyltransferase
MDVPETLLSGDHGKVDRWRREQAVIRTAARRPELVRAAWDRLTEQERALARRALAQTTEDA